ncbi:AAA family ATPase [Photobacterium sp. BZF1]|uniref:ATP-dependent DNA helicase n=1 Tax=Photobacterium sp. BZF1 TaxID=1904457 RepID=UPI001653AEA4|nr:ATP-dependent RecD-like DNA helicase [Photobacterium sp. BZF1]MBC7001774.1 AAA family ATPase [Photobacterium sp. BZF1]
MKPEPTRYDMQVSNIWKDTNDEFIFSGVPIVAGVGASGKKYVVVKTVRKKLPVIPVIGQHWRIYGTKTVSTEVKNGREIARVDITAEKLRVTMPDVDRAFVHFVDKEKAFPGVGKSYAAKLWHRYQKGIYKILADGDIQSLEAVIPRKPAESLIEGWKKYNNLKYLHWFADHSIPPSVSSDIIKYHDEDAIEQIKSNPYILQVYGMTFDSVDELALEKFKVAISDPRRLIAGVEEALYRHSQYGHTVASENDLMRRLPSILGDTDLAKEALKQSFTKADVIVDDDGYYHSLGVFVMEHVVASHFLELAKKTDTWGGEHEEALAYGIQDLPFPLTERQGEAVCESLTHSIYRLIGGAGTGKTTVLRSIFRAYYRLGYKIYPMALAGRAAKRIREATGVAARTITGFLKNVKIKEGEKAIVVIDESSMIDLPNMYRIIRAIQPDTRILLVGDIGQLAAINYGAVLRDVVQAESISGVELDIVKRQDGSTGIPEFTYDVRNGIVPSCFPANITLHQTESDDINQVVTELFKQDPENTLILADTYRNPHGGVDIINSICQQVCNPNGAQFEFSMKGLWSYLNIRVGDPIIFNNNDWDSDIQNGTMGHLIENASLGHKGMVALDDGRTLELNETLIDYIRPAYCVTLHKAQGSQFPRVIVVLGRSQRIDRSWIYTALTRAEIHIDIVGTYEQFVNAIQRLPEADRRKTSLHRLLKA